MVEETIRVIRETESQADQIVKHAQDQYLSLIHIQMCIRDRDRFGGAVPCSLEDLTSLAGVGRKTANVIRGNIYHDASVVVDTHVKRISNRLGLTKNQDPEKIEQDLMKELPKDHWILYNIQIITFGRSICTARSPKCEECFLRAYCKTISKSIK